MNPKKSYLKPLCWYVLITTIGFSSFAHATETAHMQWHRTTLVFEGPWLGEETPENPFLDYRLEVTFSNGRQAIRVPGFFAADGNAAETGADAGTVWKCHFVPPEPGVWTWIASFRTGPEIALDFAPTAGEPVGFDGSTGNFEVVPTNQSGNGFRANGYIRATGESRYFHFSGTGKPFLKMGTNSPETLLGYRDFDGTTDRGGVPLPALKDGLRDYAMHVRDWREGDPTWKGGKGKGLIGGLNYLADQKMNVVYFLTMNVQGDGYDVWPWIDPYAFYRFDVSKLEQWEIVFDHVDRLGLMLHIVTQETENDSLLDERGLFGKARKLYYRELIARFAHHLGLIWNLGEENNNSTEQLKAFSDYIASWDPYGHPIVVHNGVYKEDVIYRPLLGHPELDGISLQITPMERSYGQITRWIADSKAAGRPWVVSLDEIGPADRGVPTDTEYPSHDRERKEALWAALMAGAGGVEWYFGWANEGETSDLANEDWRNRELMWEQSRIALEFFENYLPYTEMNSMPQLLSLDEDSAYCFALPGQVYGVYFKTVKPATIELEAGGYEVKWFNPRKGGALLLGSVTRLTGPGKQTLGEAPGDPDQDWVALIRRQ